MQEICYFGCQATWICRTSSKKTKTHNIRKHHNENTRRNQSIYKERKIVLLHELKDTTATPHERDIFVTTIPHEYDRVNRSCNKRLQQQTQMGDTTTIPAR